LESAALPSGVTVVLDGSAWRGFIKFGHGQEPDSSAPARITACRCGQPVAFWDSGRVHSCRLAKDTPAQDDIAGASEQPGPFVASLCRMIPSCLPTIILIVVILAGGQLITGANFLSDVLSGLAIGILSFHPGVPIGADRDPTSEANAKNSSTSGHFLGRVPPLC
jgi:hypothetical protein